MQYRTHLTTTLAVTVPIMATTDTLTIGTVVAVSIGALFPDIDEPHSWIGIRTRGISDILNKLLGHRGMTHSILGLIIAFLTMALLVNIINFPAIIAIYFVLGYLLHLIEDSFSKSGVKWLLPLADNKFQSGGGVIYYVTGGMVENFIFLGSVAILCLEIMMLDFSTIPVPNVNISQTVNELFQKAISYVRP